MKKFSRRDFFKVAGGAVIGAATYGLTDNISHSFAQSPVIASTKIMIIIILALKPKYIFLLKLIQIVC